MKRYIYFKCFTYGGKDPCILACEDGLIPVHCPHDDDAKVNTIWEELDTSQPVVEADAEGQCIYCRHWPEAGRTKCENCGYEFRTA